MKSINVGSKTAVKQYQFDGQKKPNPPNTALTCGIAYDLLCKTMANIHKAMERDLAWLVSIIQSTDDEEPIPEWSGAITASSREGRTVGMVSHFVFGPLIDLPPAHPNTILTKVIFIEGSLRQQRNIHLSADMQLYKIIMQVKWADPDCWKSLIVHPGGMHTLMSFVGCIGTLMNSSILEELLEAAFKGI